MRRFALATSIAFALALFGRASTGEPASKDDLARARALDREGAKAYGEGRYEDAIRYFEEAYRLGGPAFEIWNIAKCHLRLDQPEQAAASLERYLALPDLPREDRAEASQQLEMLKKRPSKLTINSMPSGAQVMVDGKSVEGRTPVSITVPPGSHTVTVSSPPGPAWSQRIDARYGRAVVVDAKLARDDARPAPPPNPYTEPGEGRLSLRGGFDVVLPRHGSIGGNPGVGLLALGTYRLTDADGVSIAAGGLVSVSGDTWRNRTGLPNEATGCAPLRDPLSATALSAFGVATASLRVAPGLRASGIGGVGLAGYFVDDVGGDLFVPSCRAAPGVRPALLIGAEIDYAITNTVRLSAFPLMWQLQPAFDGTRSTPRDASGVWMRFGFGIGAGVDL